MRLSDYHAQFPQGCGLIAEDVASRVAKLLPALGEADIGQIILECELHRPDSGGDFSMQLPRSGLPGLLAALDGETMRGWREKSQAWSRVCQALRHWQDDPLYAKISDFWLEFDYVALGEKIPEPCCFFDAASISIGDAIAGPLAVLLGKAPSPALKERLERCVHAAAEVGLFQLGVMLGRKENPRPVRLFSEDLRPDQAAAFLSEAGWGTPEEREKIRRFFAWAQGFTCGNYIVSFGVLEDGLTSGLGVEFSGPEGDALEELLGALSAEGYALPEKCEGVREWLKQDPPPPLASDISHFKFPFDGEFSGCKAYMRHMPTPDILRMQNSRW